MPRSTTTTTDQPGPAAPARPAARRLATAAVLGLALTGSLFLGSAAQAAPGTDGATDLARRLGPPDVGTIDPSLARDPSLTLPTTPPEPPIDPDPEPEPELIDECPGVPGIQPSGSQCPLIPKPPCDANGDGKKDQEDWAVLDRDPDACDPPKPPCDANGDGELDREDWLHLRRDPGACQPEPPCDANDDGELDDADWDHLRRDPDACQPDIPWRPPTRIDTGGGGTAPDGLNPGQLALIAAVVTAIAGGIATAPRRARNTGGTR